MWMEEFIMETKATKEKIWSLWIDVKNWNKWDDSVEYSSLNGNFENGTKGILKTLNGPKSSFIIIDCVENKSFTSRSKLPLCTMDFVHELVDENNVLKINHCIKIYGALEFIFKNIIGKNAAKNIQIAVKKLVTLAEN
ncbi:MAG: hypothetical protein LBP59_20470 [Planctomycetaceae bacterium]|jgi:hypothetical protein|nr:hypothetical protein [Planctomycetaceae bacterium]